jgi:hypothetical protein
LESSDKNWLVGWIEFLSSHTLYISLMPQTNTNKHKPQQKVINLHFQLFTLVRTTINRRIVRTFKGIALERQRIFVMHLNAKGTTVPFAFERTWIIVSGADELAALYGQGIWWHDSVARLHRYKGQIHFDPQI